jgi:hypothetical protein
MYEAGLKKNLAYFIAKQLCPDAEDIMDEVNESSKRTDKIEYLEISSDDSFDAPNMLELFSPKSKEKLTYEKISKKL